LPGTLANGDDELGVSVDDNLVVGRVPVVLGLLGDRMVASGDHRAVHDQHGALAEPLARMQGECRGEVVDDAVSGRLRDPEKRRELPQRQVRPPVRGDQQDTVLQWQAPWPALANWVCTLAS
jgi:hypothetical protein